MPIFDISNRIGLQENDRAHNTERIQPMIPLLSEKADEEISQELPLKEKSSWFSSLAARFLFFLLLVADLIWGMYALVLSLYAFLGIGLTLGRRAHFLQMKEKGWKSLRRALVCGLALFVAILNPSFGIMIGCTYFLMYDKSGIEEVVPSSLQSQLKEFFPKDAD